MNPLAIFALIYLVIGMLFARWVQLLVRKLESREAGFAELLWTVFIWPVMIIVVIIVAIKKLKETR